LVVRDAFCAIMYSSKTYYFYQPPVFFFLHWFSYGILQYLSFLS
jgi:hypothetical protein